MARLTLHKPALAPYDLPASTGTAAGVTVTTTPTLTARY